MTYQNLFLNNECWPIITEETPLSEIKEIHRRIWNYVIEHGRKPYTPYKSDCVLCEYDKACDDDCSYCPAKWSGKDCISPESEYRALVNESDPEKKRLLAMKIRDIEFKESDDV